MFLRRLNNRIFLVTIMILVTSAVALISPPETLRQDALKALQSATFLFAICAAISLALYTNYVKGLRESYLKRLLDVRSALENFYDEHRNTQDADVQSLLNTYIIPLLFLNTHQWMTYDPYVREILPKVVAPAAAIHGKDPVFVARYLLRIEDETNELGLLYLRRVITRLHLETINGAFVLVAVGIGALGFTYLLPSGFVGDFLIVNIASAIVTFAIIELLILLSYLQQEGREEEPEEADEKGGNIEVEKPEL